MSQIDPQHPEWNLRKIGWVVFAALALFLILLLTNVPRSALWIILGVTVALTARLIVGSRQT